MPTVTIAVGSGATMQNSDYVVVHQGHVAPVGLPTTVIVAPAFGWYGAFPGSAALAKSVIHFDQPFAFNTPVVVISGGPMAEGGFPSVIQRFRAIGY